VFVSLSLIMFFNKKSAVAVVGLLLAVSTSLVGCNSATDTVKDAAKDGAKTGADAVKDATTKVKDAGATALTGAALSKVVTEAKTPLVQANSALKGAGGVEKAKTMITKFDTVWTKVSPQLEASAGDKFSSIKTGVEAVKTAAASGDKAKMGTALTAAIKSMDSLTAAKKAK
jgi:hypothetical protein